MGVSFKNAVIAGVFAALAATPAAAVTWTFDSFFGGEEAILSEDGSDTRINGSFNFNPGAGVLQSSNLVVTNSETNGAGAADGRFNQTYDEPLFASNDLTTFNFAFNLDPGSPNGIGSNTFVIRLVFASPLTRPADASDQIALREAAVGTCTGFSTIEGCSVDSVGGFGERLSFFGGSLVGAVSPVSSIPVPATLPLLLGGLAGFAFLRRGRKS